MKKNFLTAIVMVLLAIPMYAQKIVLDKTDPDGIRTIDTSSKMLVDFGKGGISYSISNYIFPNGGEDYFINITLPSTHDFSIPKDGLLLIRTVAGDVIECKQMLDDYKTNDPVGEYDRITKTTTHYIHGIFSVKIEELNKIASDGIAKVRVATSEGYREGEYKSSNQKKSKEFFSVALKKIEEAKANGSNIRDGF